MTSNRRAWCVLGMSFQSSLTEHALDMYSAGFSVGLPI